MSRIQVMQCDCCKTTGTEQDIYGVIVADETPDLCGECRRALTAWLHGQTGPLAMFGKGYRSRDQVAQVDAAIRAGTSAKEISQTFGYALNSIYQRRYRLKRQEQAA